MARLPCLLVAALVSASLVTSGRANFLQSAPPAGDHASASHTEANLAKVRQALLDEMQGALGDSRHATERRLAAHEDALRPMFAALPKNEEGLLGHAAVRYALHRYFARRHGWSVKGLDPAGGHWNASSPSSVLLDHVPALAQELFEKRLDGHGLGLHDLAALVATLEHVVHDDAVSRLVAAYAAHGLSTESSNGEDKALEALDSFMMAFVLGQDIRNLSYAELRAERASIQQTYPDWPETRAFARDVYAKVSRTQNPAAVAVATQSEEFERAKRAVAAIQDEYGPWQDRECQSMKKALVGMEEADNGRVRLADFYGRRLEGGWQFAESMDYLRQVGALDETDPSNPRVVMTNYMHSPSNCLANTGFYSVCCINECEAILGLIEQRLAAPAAPAKELEAVVAGIPSTTVRAPRNLSTPLARRLQEVAEHHEGLVPLHGRLFSQWLHHAFPRECPFPHEAGTTSPMSPEEWRAETGQATSATPEVLELHAGAREGNAAGMDGTAEAAPIPWVFAEELVHQPVKPVRLRSPEHFRVLARGAAFLVSILAMGRVLLQYLPQRGSSKTDAGLLLPLSGKQHWA